MRRTTAGEAEPEVQAVSLRSLRRQAGACHRGLAIDLRSEALTGSLGGSKDGLGGLQDTPICAVVHLGLPRSSPRSRTGMHRRTPRLWITGDDRGVSECTPVDLVLLHLPPLILRERVVSITIYLHSRLLVVKYLWKQVSQLRRQLRTSSA